jgi:hypothetical protein
MRKASIPNGPDAAVPDELSLGRRQLVVPGTHVAAPPVRTNGRGLRLLRS